MKTEGGDAVTLLDFLWHLAGGFLIVYFVTSLIIILYAPQSVPQIFRDIRAELRPFVLPLVLLTYLPNLMHDFDWHVRASLIITLIAWWFMRHNDDDSDRWKKRRKKLTSQIAVIGGRLQVVPTGAS